MLLFWYAAATAAFWTGTSIYLQVNRPRVGFLSAVDPETIPAEPAVAIIIAVRNEEANLEEALQSICRLDYPNYRVVVVNDRSTDRTPEILRKMADRFPRISVVEVQDLPAGWLGKNHALYQGYLQTREEWMLFTDADVVFAPDTLKKALAFALPKNLDHLTLLPEIRSRSQMLLNVLATFDMMLDLKLKPWAVGNPESDAYIGVGAFNLIRRAAYEKAGTHQPIALRPDDDLKIGELIKRTGGRQEALHGEDQISLEWYTSIGEFVRGLMKNTFATTNYKWPVALGMAISTLLAFALPLPLFLVFGNWTVKILGLIMLLVQLPLYIRPGRKAGNWWQLFFMPLAGILLFYIILKSTYLTLRQGGIYWRETFYSLSELKKNT